MTRTTTVRKMGTVARRAIALALAALLLGSVVGGASAETRVERSETQSARLATGEAFLEVFNPGKLGGPTACLTVSTAEGTEEGCADVTAAFTLADDLSSASLAPRAFDLYVQVCEGKACEAVYSRTVTVEATWAAAGAGQRVHERLLGGGGADDPCETVVVVTGLFQPATGTLVVDGAAAEGTGDLQALAEVTRRTCR